MHGSEGRSTLSLTASAAAALLAALCAITLATGVSQQAFEWARSPAIYAAALVRDAFWLRVQIGLDDLFIAAYVATGVLFTARLAREAAGDGARMLAGLAGVAVVAAGVLDLSENHHPLGLLDLAAAGVDLPVAEIIERSRGSQLKWMLGHVGFAFAGLAIAPTSPFLRAFRASLVAWQLPIGAATWAVTAASAWLPLLVWARYGGLIFGFATIAWLARGPRPSVRGSFARDAAATDAPA